MSVCKSKESLWAAPVTSDFNVGGDESFGVFLGDGILVAVVSPASIRFDTDIAGFGESTATMLSVLRFRGFGTAGTQSLCIRRHLHDDQHDPKT